MKSPSCRICHRCLDAHLMFGDLCVDHRYVDEKPKRPAPVGHPALKPLREALALYPHYESLSDGQLADIASDSANRLSVFSAFLLGVRQAVAILQSAAR